MLNSGDTAWVLISTALVLLMTPGLALFYGGLVNRKNILNMIMQSYIAMIILALEWVIIGYSLAFGPDKMGLIGNLSWLALNGVGVDPNPDYAATIPALCFMGFQMMFAVITPALISGAIAERMRFGAYVLFILLWSLLVYNPVAHWVWGVGGWMRTIGAIDFAGGTVVHTLSGFSALVAALFVGKRSNDSTASANNLPMTILGAGLLWFGWFGFNAGSALAANGIAALALINTNTAAAAAALAWLGIEWLAKKKLTVMGAINGSLVGLVAITPAAGFVTPMAAIALGAIGSIICYLAVTVLKEKIGYDDALDVFGIHGIGGTWGCIATGLFATTSVNAAGFDGLLYGNPALLVKQLISVGATAGMAVAGTFLILKFISLVMTIRSTEDEEITGLDAVSHGESAYGPEVPFLFPAMTIQNNRGGIANCQEELAAG